MNPIFLTWNIIDSFFVRHFFQLFFVQIFTIFFNECKTLDYENFRDFKEGKMSDSQLSVIGYPENYV